MPRLLPGRFATECVREFQLAALERYADAAALGRAERRTAAIYLYGYVVEMLLKAAYFKFLGHGDADPIDVAALRTAVGERASTAISLGLTGTRNLHDITAWSNLLVAHRVRLGRNYPEPEFATTLAGHVAVVHERWVETIRYHKNVAYRHELVRVGAACEWVVRHRDAI